MAYILFLKLECSCSDSGFRGVSAPAPLQPSAPALWQAMPFPFYLLRLVPSHLPEPGQGQPQPGQVDINPMDRFFSRNCLVDFSILAAGLWVHLAGEDSLVVKALEAECLGSYLGPVSACPPGFGPTVLRSSALI
ncbi:hypothetical protein PAL_GLEAN10003366 [Pteropus alecto]|uniref:Uncharacterized protein n=1 Tax=Pteropus alecto TaxID=9402 RepID=L5K258_PTEAL|nr:hypothetical protein PAL_GLEAN10003366 [Pteropus alecto]